MVSYSRTGSGETSEVRRVKSRTLRRRRTTKNTRERMLFIAKRRILV